MPDELQERLIAAAAAARANAYAPYSSFRVGAAIAAEGGAVHAGCNVENASIGLTVCAERAALSAAVTAGERTFTALAVVSEGAAAPCGACRQALHELAPGLAITLVDAVTGATDRTDLGSLLPRPFGPGFGSG